MGCDLARGTGEEGMVPEVPKIQLLRERARERHRKCLLALQKHNLPSPLPSFFLPPSLPGDAIKIWPPVVVLRLHRTASKSSVRLRPLSRPLSRCSGQQKGDWH